MNYDVNKLYMGLVEYYKKNIKVLELHTLYDDMNSEELMDLNLERPILPYGNEEYYKRSLISFKEILMRSKINYGHLSREDAFKICDTHDGYYFMLLRLKNIRDVEDLKVPKGLGKSKKKY